MFYLSADVPAADAADVAFTGEHRDEASGLLAWNFVRQKHVFLAFEKSLKCTRNNASGIQKNMAQA
jgi:hypothetical protein